MKWRCPEDEGALDLRDGGLVCASCGSQFPFAARVPQLVADLVARSRTQAEVPEFAELVFLCTAPTADLELTAFAEKLGLWRARHGTDWRYLLPVPPGGTVLELSPGGGDETMHLASRAAHVLSLAPHVELARLIARRSAEEAPAGNIEVAVASSLVKLPVATGSIDALVFLDRSAPAWGVTSRALDGVVAEWNRVLKVGGTVLVGVGNPLHRLPGMAQATRALRGTKVTSLDSCLASAPASGLRGGLSPRRVRAALSRHGFAAAVPHAPLPDGEKVHVVLPVADSAIVQYFLRNMVRKNGLSARMAIRAASLATRLGLFPHVVPHLYLVAERREDVTGGRAGAGR